MKNLSDALNPNIQQTAAENAHLKKLFSQCMPTEMLDQILFARIADDKLRLTTGNSVWASRIRFYSRELINSCASQYPGIRQVSVHVLPASKKVDHTRQITREKPSAGPHVATRINQVADSIEDDELSAALRRLAENLNE